VEERAAPTPYRSRGRDIEARLKRHRFLAMHSRASMIYNIGKISSTESKTPP
jgi:hypothetical protein